MKRNNRRDKSPYIPLEDRMWDTFKLELCEGNTEDAFKNAIRQTMGIVTREMVYKIKRMKVRP